MRAMQQISSAQCRPLNSLRIPKMGSTRLLNPLGRGGFRRNTGYLGRHEKKFSVCFNFVILAARDCVSSEIVYVISLRNSICSHIASFVNILITSCRDQ